MLELGIEQAPSWIHHIAHPIAHPVGALVAEVEGVGLGHVVAMGHKAGTAIDRSVGHHAAVVVSPPSDSAHLTRHEAAQLAHEGECGVSCRHSTLVEHSSTFIVISQRLWTKRTVVNSCSGVIFVIESEESVASGVRRIVARTSLGAYELLKKRENILNQARDLLGIGSINDVPNKLKALQNEKDAYRKEADTLKQKLANATSGNLANEFKEQDGLLVLFKYLKDQKRDSLLKIVDSLKANKDNYLIALVGEENGGYPVVVAAGKAANDKGYLAGKLVKDIASLLGGSGGGRPDLASGAGRDIAKIEEAKKLIMK